MLREVLAVYSITVCNSNKLFSVDLEFFVTKGTLKLGGHAASASVDFNEKRIDVGWE